MESFNRNTLWIILSILVNSSLCYNFKQSYIARNGLTFPTVVEVAEGHDVRVQLLRSVPGQECVLKMPDFSIVDLKEKHEKYEFWGEHCGVKINNINETDEGIWRLRSKNNTNNLEGTFTIIVKDIPSSVIENINVNVFDDAKPAVIEFVKRNMSYCYISQKDSPESVTVAKTCKLELPIVNKNIQGYWTVNLGIPGKIEEEVDKSLVNVHTESINVGYLQKDDKTVAMHCNLKKSEKTLDFCRFERVRDEKGFNLKDGIGKRRYSYYGNGFHKKECGIMIQNPTDEDFGNWKCSLGALHDDKITILHRMLMLRRPTSRILIGPARRHIIGVPDEELNIKCQANTTISYCSLTHPNGTEFPPVISKDSTENLPYWYSFDRLDLGECEIVIKHATPEDSGKWVCHMASKFTPGVEVTDDIDVRIGGPITAVEPILPVKFDNPATLSCLSAGGMFPLRYCRFVTPDGVRFEINDQITSEKPILGQYYFHPNSSTLRGECVLSINSVKREHLGEWKCAAMIEKTNKDVEREGSDVIELRIEGGDNLSTASMTGIVLGFIALVVVTGAFGMFIWRRRISLRNRWRESTSTSPSARPTLQEPVHFTGRTSAESDHSETHFTIQSPGYSPVATATTSAHKTA